MGKRQLGVNWAVHSFSSSAGEDAFLSVAATKPFYFAFVQGIGAYLSFHCLDNILIVMRFSGAPLTLNYMQYNTISPGTKNWFSISPDAQS